MALMGTWYSARVNPPQESNKKNKRIKKMFPKKDVYLLVILVVEFESCIETCGASSCLDSNQHTLFFPFFFIRTFVWEWILNIFATYIKQSFTGTEILPITK